MAGESDKSNGTSYSWASLALTSTPHLSTICTELLLLIAANYLNLINELVALFDLNAHAKIILESLTTTTITTICI